MKAVIAHHGGTVEKFVGDAVLAVFGIPLVHEDDALRAVRAAVEMRAALEDLNKEFERDKGVTLDVRTGINTGEVVAGDLSLGQEFVIGDAVNVAARLEQSAPPGEILLGPQTYRLVKNAVEVETLKPLELKGKSEPFPAFRLISLAEKAAGYSRRLDSPLVGRGYELEILRGAFDRSVRERSCHLFTILGSAGVGKSRLVAEFLGEKEDPARVIQGRCLPYGEGITYWPLAEIIKDAARVSETDSATDAKRRLMDLLSNARDAERITGPLLQLLGLEQSAATTEEFGWASRRMLETMAQGSPLVVVFEDIHWAEPALLDTIEYLADWSRDSSILLLCVARPELLDERSSWGGGKMNATSILLEPLTAAESDQLVHALLGSARLGAEVTGAVSTAAEGNPLFVEQMLDMLVDEGLLTQETDGWMLSGTMEDIEVPPTIHALISARLDKLKDQERQVIERASVIGSTFSVNAVRHLSPGSEKDDVSKHLMALVRKELIRQSEDGLDDEESFRFRHILIRDATYDSISKETRADMHLRFASWLEELKTSETIGFEEILAHHLSEAHRYRGELGSPADELRSLALEAAAHYETSGLRALARNDYRAAGKLLRHGSELLDDPLDYARLVLPLAEVLYLQGRSNEALQLLERIEEADAEILNAKIEIVRTSILFSTDPQAQVRKIQESARSSILLFER
ncbi:MAG: AAA family ATPase, partial [Actinobacteria bacterium]|nr:AAA family ATPase [Actinomycetota bacterium]